MNSPYSTRLFLLSFVLAGMQGAPPVSQACETNPARQVVDYLLATEFEQATFELGEWFQRDENHPMLAFYRAVTLWARAEAVDEIKRPQLQEQALSELRDVIQHNAETLDEEPANSDVKLGLGMAQAFSARVYLKRGEWTKAYRIGRAGRDTLRDLLQEDPDASDAYLILGLYEYYTGSVPFLLRWLTSLVDLAGDSEKGVAYLEKAVRDAPVAAPEAARALLTEVGPLERRCRYIPLAREMAERYSGNQQFMHIHGYLVTNCPEAISGHEIDTGAVEEKLVLNVACDN